MTQEGAIPPDLWEQIDQRIDRKVADLARSGMLRNASISGGAGLSIKDGGTVALVAADGTVTFYIGPVLPRLPDGTRQQGWIVRREDDTVALALYDPDPSTDFKQFLAIYDRQGNIIVSDDTDSGQGLARPYVPLVFYEARNTDWPTVTSGTFQTVFRARASKQQPRLFLRIWGANDTAGATGEVRVMVNDVQLGGVYNTVSGVVTEFIVGPTPINGAHMAGLKVEIQARLASGAGGVQVGIGQAQGQQS